MIKSKLLENVIKFRELEIPLIVASFDEYNRLTPLP